jgi:lysophospholipase L1-like esterase
MILLRILLPLLLAALLLGNAESQTLVAFGDSTTAPRGKLEIYADLLHKELSFEGKEVAVINAGVPGNTTTMAAKRFEKDVLAAKPDVVIVQFGINDSAIDVWKNPPAVEPRVKQDVYGRNLRDFVRTLKGKGARVVLMTPNPLCWTDALKAKYGHAPYQPEIEDGFNVLLRKYAETVLQIASEENVGLVDVFAAFNEHARQRGASSPSDLLLDGMHPNNAGHRLVADLIMAHLAKADPRFMKNAAASAPK